MNLLQAKYAEKRRHKRKNLETGIVAINELTGDELGVIGNISVGGLMLISRQPIFECALYQISVPFNLGNKRIKYVRMGIESLWCTNANTPGYYWTGFKTVDMSEEDAKIIEQLVNS